MQGLDVLLTRLPLPLHEMMMMGGKFPLTLALVPVLVLALALVQLRLWPRGRGWLQSVPRLAGS